MPANLLDANIVLRFLTNDPPDMGQRAHRTFEAIRAGTPQAILEDVVVAEIAWTLRSYYRADKHTIAQSLRDLVSEPNILNSDKDTLYLALVLYQRHNLSFADGLLAARALTHGDTEIISFDRGLDHVPGIIRVEPP